MSTLGILRATQSEVDAARGPATARFPKRIDDGMARFTAGSGKAALEDVKRGISLAQFLERHPSTIGLPGVHTFSTTALERDHPVWTVLVQWGLPGPQPGSRAGVTQVVLEAARLPSFMRDLRSGMPASGDSPRVSTATTSAVAIRELFRTVEEVIRLRADLLIYWMSWDCDTGLRLAAAGVQMEQLRDALASRNPDYLLNLRRSITEHIEKRLEGAKPSEVRSCDAERLVELIMSADGDRRRLVSYDEANEEAALDYLLIGAGVAFDPAKKESRHALRALSEPEKQHLRNFSRQTKGGQYEMGVGHEVAKRWRLQPQDLEDGKGAFRSALESEVSGEVAERLDEWNGEQGQILVASCRGH